MSEFPGSTERDLNPYTTFLNHLYVYPLSLSFESQKIFSRARNLAVTVQVRNCDEIDAKPLEVRSKFDSPTSRLKREISFLVHLPSTRSERKELRVATFLSDSPPQHIADVVRGDQNPTSRQHHATASSAVLLQSHLVRHQEEGAGELAGESRWICLAAAAEQRKAEHR